MNLEHLSAGDFMKLEKLFSENSIDALVKLINGTSKTSEKEELLAPGTLLKRFPGKYEELGAEIGELVDKKNAAYGDSFNKSGNILREFYPKGISPDQYDDALGIIRVIDKMFRIATDKDAFGENPWQDIGGYGILKSLKRKT